MLLLKVFSLELELFVLSFSHQVLDIVRKLLVHEIIISILFPILLNLGQERMHFTSLNKLGQHVMIELDKNLVVELLKDAIHVAHASLIHYELRVLELLLTRVQLPVDPALVLLIQLVLNLLQSILIARELERQVTALTTYGPAHLPLQTRLIDHSLRILGYILNHTHHSHLLSHRQVVDNVLTELSLKLVQGNVTLPFEVVWYVLGIPYFDSRGSSGFLAVIACIASDLRGTSLIRIPSFQG